MEEKDEGREGSRGKGAALEIGRLRKVKFVMKNGVVEVQ